MAMSWLVALFPALSLKSYPSFGPLAPAKGIVVKNYIDQSQELALCDRDILECRCLKTIDHC